jgi:hypothetical protein
MAQHHSNNTVNGLDELANLSGLSAVIRPSKDEAAQVEEHLVHAWLALKSALLADEREMCRIEYAKNRLACLESAPVVAGVKSRQMKAFRLEVESLRAAIEAHKL